MEEELKEAYSSWVTLKGWSHDSYTSCALILVAACILKAARIIRG